MSAKRRLGSTSNEVTAAGLVAVTLTIFLWATKGKSTIIDKRWF